MKTGTGGYGEGQSAYAAQHAGDKYADIAHLYIADTDAVRCLRDVAAGAQSQAQPRLIENDDRGNQQQYGDGGGQVEAFEDQAVEKHIL